MTLSYPNETSKECIQLLNKQNCENTDNKIISIKKKGQSTTKKLQSCVKIVKLPIKKLLVFVFTRQGLSGSYQIRSSSIWT